MKGVGAYFRALREGQGITRAWVAERAGTTETSLYRIESGRQKPGLELMLGIIDAVRGSVADVRKLLVSADNDADVGEQLAEQWLVEARQIATDPKTSGVARRLLEDPAFYAALERAAMERTES